MTVRSCLLLAALAVVGCGGKSDPPSQTKGGLKVDLDALRKPKAGTPSETSSSTTLFAAADAGIEFTYRNGAAGQLLMPEAIGGGCGWLDYDADGRWDAYLGQGGDCAADPSPDQPADRLFRLQADGKFVDVSQRARIAGHGYTIGVAVGDYNGDGFDDVYVCNTGANTLYQNQGDGTFLDVTQQAGVGDQRWSSGAAWADLDKDGDLDLYVCNYTIYDCKNPVPCGKDGLPGICHPRMVDPSADECFINRGDGTFAAEAKQRGLHGKGNKALSLAIADFTGDSWPDIYVANDTTENFLFVGDGDGTFSERAVINGCAYNRNAEREASMGLGIADFDYNGWLDVYATHYFGESNTLYRSLGSGRFRDETGLQGLHDPTFRRLAFGVVMCDFCLDGRQELLIANGHIDELHQHHRQQAQMFAFNGDPDHPRWIEHSDQAGDYFQRPLVGRGVATSDYDEDGDLDALIIHQNDPAVLLNNATESKGHWLKLSFVGQGLNPRGIGAKVVVRCGDLIQQHQLCGGTSYAVTHQPILVFGFGPRERAVEVEVTWPNGRTQQLTSPVDRWLQLEESQAGA